MTHFDDKTILDHERLLRRIHPEQWIYDGKLGRRRPTSAAFQDVELSVDLATSFEQRGVPVTQPLIGHPGFLLSSVTAGTMRANAQAVVRDPLPDNTAHALVVGKKTQRIQRNLAISALWIVPPIEA